MANRKHVAILKQAAAANKLWRSQHLEVWQDLDVELLNDGHHVDDHGLTGADLTGSALRNADLSYLELRAVKFSNANLAGASLVASNLRRAVFCRADLQYVDFTGAKLSEADFRGADLTGANFSDAELNDADFSEANLGLAVFRFSSLERSKFDRATLRWSAFLDVDLSKCIGLESIQHEAPSTVGVDAIYKSRGTIPEIFLRDCGVPEELIAYIPSLLGATSSIQYESCFISYSHADEDFCKRLHSRMRDENLRVWYAPEDMPFGKKLHQSIERAIQVYDRLLVVLSAASMSSEWVQTEIYNARQREVKEKRQILFPIRLVPFEQIRDWSAFDADTGRDMAREIREYFIPDFSSWRDHDHFEAAFKRLLDALKQSAEPHGA